MAQTLYLLAGASGSGKSTLISASLPGGYTVSGDAWRGELYGNEDIQHNHPLTFRMAGRESDQAIQAGHDLVSDQTALSPFAREKELKRAERHGITPRMLFIDASLEELMDGQRQRAASGGRNVPEAAVRRMYGGAKKLRGLIEHGKLDEWNPLIIPRAELANFGVLLPGTPPPARFTRQCFEAEWKYLIEQEQVFRHQLVEAGYGHDLETLNPPEQIAEQLAPLQILFRTQHPQRLAGAWDHLLEARALLVKISEEDSAREQASEE